MGMRPSIEANWQTPTPIVELAQPSALVVDGFLTDDGTMLLFNVEQPGNTQGEMYRAWRLSADEQFSSPVSLGTGLNSTTLNRDPWLSPDGNHFFFSSDRSGTIMIYEADTAQDQ
jgi:Tol biopolymer transport system component